MRSRLRAAWSWWLRAGWRDPELSPDLDAEARAYARGYCAAIFEVQQAQAELVGMVSAEPPTVGPSSTESAPGPELPPVLVPLELSPEEQQVRLQMALADIRSALGRGEAEARVAALRRPLREDAGQVLHEIHQL